MRTLELPPGTQKGFLVAMDSLIAASVGPCRSASNAGTRDVSAVPYVYNRTLYDLSLLSCDYEPQLRTETGDVRRRCRRAISGEEPDDEVQDEISSVVRHLGRVARGARTCGVSASLVDRNRACAGPVGRDCAQEPGKPTMKRDTVRRLAALVLYDDSPITVGGLTLTERAVLLAHRAGLGPVRVWGVRALDRDSDARLRSRGIPVVRQPPDAAPLEGSADDEGLVIIGPHVLFAPAVLTDLVSGTELDGSSAAIAACVAGAPLLLLCAARGGRRSAHMQIGRGDAHEARDAGSACASCHSRARSAVE